MRRFDSMIAVSESDSDRAGSDISDHSAIDGYGKEEECWSFLTTQFEKPRPIELKEEHLKKGNCLEYIL